MNCARRKRLQLNRVLCLFSVVLCSLWQPIISAKLNDPLPLPQVLEDLVDESEEGFEETASGTVGLKEPLTTTNVFKATDQVMAEIDQVHHRDTADYKESILTPPLQTSVHCTSVTPEPFTNTSPASPGEIQNVGSKYPADLFAIKDQRQGWVILHIIGIMYMFLSVVIVCDKFLVPALGVITDKLGIADDVTGATFMAAGVSAPKLLAILIGVFVTRSIVFFFGTVVCLAAFNVLFVIGMCALFSRGVLHVTWWPLFRDISFFILCIIMIIIFLLDSVIMWWESMLLVFCYALYMVFMKFNKKLQQVFKTQPRVQKNNVEVISVQEQEKKSRKFFAVTFLGSVLWITVFSYFMVWWAYQVGETIGISDLVMISVAAEMSIPGLITSVIVARKGLGDMAVSSSMGSNIFSITVCLPVPWLLISVFHGFVPVPVNNSGLLCMVVLLILPLLYIIITIASCKWKVNKTIGLTMLLFYTIFQLVRVMFQYKFIVCPV
ncbi:sodium/potassium/calcium exchanger 1-like isoform X2 [Halichoeres trimaculatus]|uniref:sodium/potassium/calcium exchanger 1-like isoform X2 n=1 Tax=Halichoeres trimaculatus TaxID=147232 RepID=UPI003D9F5DBD